MAKSAEQIISDGKEAYENTLDITSAGKGENAVEKFTQTPKGTDIDAANDGDVS